VKLGNAVILCTVLCNGRKRERGKSSYLIDLEGEGEEATSNMLSNNLCILDLLLSISSMISSVSIPVSLSSYCAIGEIIDIKYYIHIY